MCGNRISVLDVPFFRDAAAYLTEWLDHNMPAVSPGRYDALEPGLGHRRSVEWIVNENTCKEHWNEVWFQDGIVAFALVALEREGAVYLEDSGAERVKLHFRNGEVLSLEEFRSGELIPEYKHAPGFRDLNWGCVAVMARSLEKYS
jgi:hypothetical protein